MKFLCVPCDKPMTLEQVSPPDRGSVSLTYSCDSCGYEMAMLTNPLETQLVSSLGVKIGPDGERTEGESKCPFTGMLAEMGAETEAGGADGVDWTAEARRRMESIPEFVRPMAKSGIEKFAADHGYPQVDEKVLDEARDFFGM